MSDTSTTPPVARGRSRWQPKHVIILAAILGTVVVFMPVAVNAAGQFVTITDPAVDSRQAKVSSNQGLVVEQRPGVITNGRSVEQLVVPNRRTTILSFNQPARFVISELSVAADSNPGTTMTVVFERFTRITGTGTCQSVTTNQTGFLRVALRTVKVSGQQTEQLTFPSSLIAILGGVNLPNGAPICMVVNVSGPTGSTVSVGLTGYNLIE